MIEIGDKVICQLGSNYPDALPYKGKVLDIEVEHDTEEGDSTLYYVDHPGYGCKWWDEDFVKKV